jgi:hypothetical protein
MGHCREMREPREVGRSHITQRPHVRILLYPKTHKKLLKDFNSGERDEMIQCAFHISPSVVWKKNL